MFYKVMLAASLSLLLVACGGEQEQAEDNQSKGQEKAWAKHIICPEGTPAAGEYVRESVWFVEGGWLAVPTTMGADSERWYIPANYNCTVYYKLLSRNAWDEIEDGAGNYVD